VEFTGGAWFGGATFPGEALFDQATFTGGASFERASFSGRASFGGVQILRFDDPELNDSAGRRRVWPDGWTARADRHDPTHGTLVPATVEEPGRSVES
jgi:hypothetical protein